ncbi:ribose 5-phosphate isomerase B [Adhaeribacter radiodurans]|uniref:Ribose 5-phosphate isomerase B n=1 Tax=Adhaeribacter radiodurans TaxID=2745197 RepID=A0A7L7LEM8_9BACT|nr:ribose 5-phosphate isomerase B [Adhaeribacter radiodurans]QMU30955.1 ribose 5-phosphate isomerase B [Adhaeribacter radiodurans]
MALVIAVGGDHAGYQYKKNLIALLQEQKHTVRDFGPDSDASVDYPDHVHPLAKAVENKEVDFGILICGSGNGVAITANKHPQVRAALCWLPELAQLARSHNNANILCIPARFVTEQIAHEMVEEFLSTSFEGGRHQTRVSKISC